MERNIAVNVSTCTSYECRKYLLNCIQSGVLAFYVEILIRFEMWIPQVCLVADELVPSQPVAKLFACYFSKIIRI
jgi:hypothetical protein